MSNPEDKRMTRLAIAAPHPAAVAAARAVAQRGGNAIDAAVAAAVALTVVYPHMCSVGGDALILIRRPGGGIRCINATGAFGSGPASVAVGSQEEMPVHGPSTVTVPGAVSGWTALLASGGRLPVADVLAPAIGLAGDGVPVSAGLAAALDQDRAHLAEDPGIREVFFPGGTVLTQGDRLALRALAEDGLTSFYRGRVAQRLATGLATLGTPITASDLAGHEASIEAPLTADVAGHRISTAAPNSQGFTLLRNLGALAAGGGLESVDVGVMAELFYASDALRDGILADPRFIDVDVERYLTPDAMRDAYRDAAAAGDRPASLATRRPDGDTIGLTVVDEEGTAVSLIQSVFHAFGARILEPATGLVLHNRGAMFSLDPESPNRLAVGKRPAHTLVPVLVEFADGRLSAHGTMGGKAQSQIQTQLFLRAVEGCSPTEIVSAPRIVVGATEAGEANDTILVEGGHADAAIAQLTGTGMELVLAPGRHPNAGHSMVSTRGADGRLAAAADPRSDGTADVLPARCV